MLGVNEFAIDLAWLFVNRVKTYQNQTQKILDAMPHVTEATIDVSDFHIKYDDVEWVNVEIVDNDDYQILSIFGYATLSDGKLARLEGSVPLQLALMNDKVKIVDYFTKVKRLSIFNSINRQDETRVH